MSNLRVSHKLKTIVMPYDPRVVATIPHAKKLTRHGNVYTLVPHRATEVKLLTNLGYEPPSPILTQYDWCNTIPYEHQKITSAMLAIEPRAYVLNGLGSGKTRSAAFAADFLIRQGDVSRVLVIAPLSTLSGTWEHELFQIMPHHKVEVLYGTKAKRLEALARDASFYIINTDGVSVILDALLARPDIDLIIIDELACYRNSRTKRWKALKKLVNTKHWCWGMTGLPTPNGPTDAYGQAKMLTPKRVPQSFRAFQGKVEYQITQFKWLPKPEANDVVSKAMQPSVRFATDDCIDLPPTTYSTRTTELAAEQKKAYKQLFDHFYTEYKGQEINASNAGVKMSKLLQVAAGFGYTDGGVVDFPDNHKIQVVKDIIEETEQKILILAPFIRTVDTLYDELKCNFYPVKKVYGGTTKKERDAIFSAFRNEVDPRIIVAHPAVLSHGLTLVEANVIVWFSPTTSYETFEQANARIVRPGQKHHTHIISIESCPVEAHIFKRLASKQKVSTALLDIFADMTKGEQ